MKRPCIVLDVSKGSSHYQSWINEETKLHNVKRINHNKEGFNELILEAKEVEQSTNEKPVFVFEATGIYHRSLQNFLQSYNYDFIIISPLLSAKVRKSNIRSTKTDKKDCRNIAKVYFQKELSLYGKTDEIYDKMRDLNRYYHYLNEQLKKIKVQFRMLLDIVFPNIDSLWSDMYSLVPMAILKKFHHPDELKNKHPESLAKYIMKETNHHTTFVLKEAKKIIEFSKVCCPGCQSNSVVCLELNEVINQLLVKQEAVDSCLNELVSLAEEIPNYQLLKTIDGISSNLASRIIAELGDINRFNRVRQITAYAGLDPFVYQSGEIDGLHLRISKKGNKILRCLLYLAVQNTLQKDNKITDFYHKKIAEGMNPKSAKIACMNKLLRVIYSMCKNGLTFQH